MPGDIPMPPDRFQDLLRARQRGPQPDPLHEVATRTLPASTSPLAAELLDEASSRRLESGELLLVTEETALDDLEAAAARIAVAAAPTATPDDPLHAALAEPRLLSARVDQVLAWQPPLAEYLRLLDAALRGGAALRQTMLVGHVETFPERVEHLMRLRDVRDAAAGAGGRLVVAVALAEIGDLPRKPGRLRAVARRARPDDAAIEVRATEALARIALGPDTVVASEHPSAGG